MGVINKMIRMINYSTSGKIWSVGMLLLTLTGCGGREDMAPVEELNWRVAHSHAQKYIVRRGDTLYAIAFRYDRDYQDLALANHLNSPYALRVGQIISLEPRIGSTRVSPPPRAHQQRQRQIPQLTHRVTPGPNAWLWPASGHVAAHFVPDQGKKGLDIAGKKGDKIYAARQGTVAYAGSGLAGYGNLIIIKHDNQYLTAYGNNARNLVTEGQSIQAGQVIADMGLVDRRYWGLHFEIRQSGKPVNPLNYLR